ncbi:hypothetical protein UPYG_G00295530 [Umbra pygmaea]|uniref:Fibronectin type-III domain-containing protein n=1 Tax=Umbra pygmaea TaxID=75934 RepID=A0ABD0W9P9_UMBPY
MDAVQSISTNYRCSDGIVTVNWEQVSEATSYRADAIDGNGTVLSCFSILDTCDIPIATCGETYQVQVTAFSGECQSTSNIPTSFDTVPCPPSELMTYRECSSNLIVFSWAPTNNTFYYVAKSVDLNGREVECVTVDTSCFFTDTDCGQSYQFTLYSVSDCNSGTSSPKHVRTAPCLPQNIITSVDCASDSLITTWDLSAGALFYMVEANGTKERNYNCSSQNNSCTIPGVACGDSLSVWITARDHECITEKVLGEAAETAPCPPDQVQAFRDCAANQALIVWQSYQKSGFYVASMEDQDGGWLSCNTTNSNSCNISQLRCGQKYSVTVTHTDGICPSTSAPITMDAEPCPPTNLSSVINCSSGSTLLSWSPSPNAVSYSGKVVGPNGAVLSCNTSTTSCVLGTVVCGEEYNLTVSASDGTCVSSYSAPLLQESAPCAPVNVVTLLNCNTNILMVSWDAGPKPLNYSATAWAEDGTAVSCNVTNTTCSLAGLHCGQQYNVTVMASYGSCSGPNSSPQLVQTGAYPLASCIPQNVTGNMTCRTHNIVASWSSAPGANSYVTMVMGPNGYSASCNTTSLSCPFTGLQCASQYDISVMSQGGSCNSSVSQIYSMTTAPCDPVNVSYALKCGTDIVTVSWDASSGAVAYSVFAQVGSSAQVTSCTTNTTSCQLSPLSCGQEYNVTVLADNGLCHSTGETITMVMTAPCPPTGLASSLNCGTDSATLSWTPVPNALGYMANATSTDGQQAWCSSANNASCKLTGLHCGETYSVTAITEGNQCASGPSASLNFTTAPCAPTMVIPHYNCSSNTALVNWTGRWAASPSWLSWIEGTSETTAALQAPAAPSLTCTVATHTT